jgi:hypothetical protein
MLKFVKVDGFKMNKELFSWRGYRAENYASTIKGSNGL